MYLLYWVQWILYLERLIDECKKIHKEQPETFKFNDKSMEAANKIVSNYPDGKQQSAVMALLYIAQRQNDNWIPLQAMKYIAKFLEMPYIKVYEVATFTQCIIYLQLVNISFKFVLQHLACLEAHMI